MLSADQVADYRRDGFLCLPGFVDPAACSELKLRAEELVDGFEPDDTVRSIFSTAEQTRTSDDYFLTSGDQVRFFFEPDAFGDDGELVQAQALSINKIAHAMHDLDEVFDAFSHSAALAEVAADIGFQQPRLLQSMYIFKQPHIGGEVTSHVDHTFLWTEPQSATGFWFAIEAATEENGCMWALPGGHEQPVRSRFRRADGGGGTTFDTFDEAPYPTEGLVPLEAGVGTLILLHGLLPHRSGPNRSSVSRHAYTLHAIEADAEYPADNWLQRRPDLPMRGFEPN